MSAEIRFRPRWLVLAAASIFGPIGTVGAFPIDVGNPDWSVRFDNTIKLSALIEAACTSRLLVPCCGTC